MKKHLQLLLVLLLFAIPNLSTANTNQINFLEVPFSEVQAEAKKADKYFFTYFYGDWCLGCQIMDESTFTDQRLIEYIEANYIPSKVDVHSTLGKEWEKNFSISCMPIFIFFDSEGNELDRYETTFTGSALLTILTQLREPGSQQAVAHLNQKPSNLFDAPILEDATAQSTSSSTISSTTVANTNNPSLHTSGSTMGSTHSTRGTMQHASNPTSSSHDTNNEITSTGTTSAAVVLIDQHIADLERILNDNDQIGDLENEQTGKAIDTQDNKLQGINNEIVKLIDEPNNQQSIEQQCQQFLSDPASLKELITHLKALKTLAAAEKQTRKHNLVTSTAPASKPKPILIKPAPPVQKANTRKVVSISREPTNIKVQVGYYKDYDNALRKVNLIKGRFSNREVYMVNETRNDAPRYRVLIGGFHSKYEAKSFAQSLKSMGYKTILKQ